MQRAKVCVRCVSTSGQNHLRLVKVKDIMPEIADHEAAYLDNTGKYSHPYSIRRKKKSINLISRFFLHYVTGVI